MSPSLPTPSLSGPSPKRVLVIAEGQLGDLLLLTPALRAIKESFPASHITVLVLQRRFYESGSNRNPAVPIIGTPQGGTSVVLTNGPYADTVVEIDRTSLRSLSPVSRLRTEFTIVSWLRRGKFDTVICTFPQDRFCQWAFLSGAGCRVGEEGKGMSFLLNRRVAVRKSDGGVLRYYCALAAAAGAQLGSYQTSFVVPEEARAWAGTLLRSWNLGDGERFVVLHPGASGLYKVWPPERFAGLVDHLQKKRKVPVVLCGSEFDLAVLDAVRQYCPPDVRVAVIRGDVSRLAALLEKCALCISNNSGPRHLAVAVGAASFAIFARFEERKWKIYGDEARRGTIQSDDACPACGTDECRNRVPPGEEFGSYCIRAVGLDDVISRVDPLLA